VLDYTEPAEVTSLRAELRSLVDELLPPGFLGAFTEDPAGFATTEMFSRELGRRHLLAMAWPSRYGGQDASVWEQTALREEMWAAHEPRGPQYMGLNWVGPVLMRFGTEEQKAKYLPPIAAGDVVWCQGFSEPEAGSDLPNLRTKATKVEGGWRINGQKIWTSYPLLAGQCFLLARTGAPDSGRKGITVFLIRMDQPGVEVRPIRAMVGYHQLNEMFFDDFFVADEDILGEVNGGWDIVGEVLKFERIGIARYARCEKLLSEAPGALGAAWGELPASLRERWTACLVRAREVQLMAYRLLERTSGGSPEYLGAALYRMGVTTLDQEVAEVLMEIAGNLSLGVHDVDLQWYRAVEDHWRYAQASTVASGTLEMNQQTAARRLITR